MPDPVCQVPGDRLQGDSEQSRKPRAAAALLTHATNHPMPLTREPRSTDALTSMVPEELEDDSDSRDRLPDVPHVGDTQPQAASQRTPTESSRSSSRVDRGPIEVLTLRKEVLLNGVGMRFIYHLVEGAARVLPALVIYGGTAGLLVCSVCSYRWGVLLSLTLYSLYMFHLCLAMLIFSIVGLVRVWTSSRENWYSSWCDEQAQMERLKQKYGLSDDGALLEWSDVQHVVMIPSYKTPDDILIETIQVMEKFEGAKTNLAVVLAFEEREPGIEKKAEEMREKFKDRFWFVLTTFHPPNLPGHVPGKSSNECWAFQQLRRELKDKYGINDYDHRVCITVIDDDSELHENYFEALTYHFLTAPEHRRYCCTWQPPICHFKNYLRQPVLVRVSSLFATLNELANLANPADCHVNYSSYSLSLRLASSVGGWDPEFLAEDWHMFAKCSLMTGGRVRCIPIFLPLLNYTPEEETYWGTLVSRWVQAKRHALGVSELVYVLTGIHLGVLEIDSWDSKLVYVWKMMPLLGKFTQSHFTNGMSSVLTILAQLVIHFYMWRSWCYVSSLDDTTGACRVAMSSATQSGIEEEQIVLNSWLVYWQQRITAGMAISSILSGGLGAAYFHLVKDRIEGDVDGSWSYSNPIWHWLRVEMEVSTCGLLGSLIYGALPLWIAVTRIIREVQFTHVVAGMVGRSDNAAE